MAVEYGTIGIRPRGEWDPDTKYDLLNLVVYDGSSYVAHTNPPIGTLPTDPAYWQTSAQGTSKATADSVGTVKPDGTTTEVSADGAISAKTATTETKGIIKGSRSINISANGGAYIPTEFIQPTDLTNLISGEILDVMLGKISKAISVTMGLDQDALLKNMLTSIDTNDTNKIPTSAYVHTLTERIGMGTELATGDNLTKAVNSLNSNLDNKADKIIYTSMPPDVESAFGFAYKYPNAIAPYDGLNWVDMPTVEAGYYGRIETRGYFNNSHGGTILFYDNSGVLIASRGFTESGWPGDWIRYVSNSDLVPVYLWLGNTSSGNITLSNSIDNYKAIIITVGSPAEPGYDTHIIRQWLEGGDWKYSEQGKIIYPVYGGYVKLTLVSATQITINHADLPIRAIHGVVK